MFLDFYMFMHGHGQLQLSSTAAESLSSSVKDPIQIQTCTHHPHIISGSWFHFASNAGIETAKPQISMLQVISTA